MIKKIRISVSVLGLIVLFSIVFNSIVNAMQIDINMNRSFYETFSGGRRVEYHTGNIIPTDDVSGRAGKSLEAYANRPTYVKVEVKGISGGIGRHYTSHSNDNGDTWVYTPWTDDPNDDDTAEYAKYWFNGYIIELR
ncbi:hypothetical protein ABGF49_03720 [Helcococcus ovis]|uniref:Uncharacterized protein n=1 Tax=Helcococcus ovis TaxID=72026 RepID=A0A4R9BZW3_9FIRM|nr:hypothetical protein [Helcococcus ovis]TFF64024.1 hypothetical protein EQF92_07410 [Helcococcus ovis]TFF64734.1 hypothetical protein EQF91_07240 [Helcococcus ovis]